ncbi:hypothetical protein Pan97_25020 [Bremerella volcania]|uniref:Uncharacterized protein n=1 Tax=Bremerella volcania TaxID=2527984 RepID=A0A518C8D7_9BACT|nr:hypothetical protein [Bremerella volcania]QDU75470.1 hypothetical protein Pan97_25020 [Bremerella volcania]
MTDAVEISLELDEIDTSRGCFWAQLVVHVEVTGRHILSAAIMQIDVIDFASDATEADDLASDERHTWCEEIAAAVLCDGLLSEQRLLDQAIAEVERSAFSREESFREELARGCR